MSVDGWKPLPGWLLSTRNAALYSVKSNSTANVLIEYNRGVGLSRFFVSLRLKPKIPVDNEMQNLL